MTDTITTSPFQPPGDKQLYHAYAIEEDAERSASHYEQDPRFYYTQTGGEWNVYSCLMWEDGFTTTQAQEKKLDKLAELMELKPGMRILDVGCGWGGPLVYLCRKYGVTGQGITVSPRQVTAARARAARYGVEATFELIHWQNLPETTKYDRVYSDEVIVHFFDLGDFFAKCHKLLQPAGVMAHKELHLTHSSHAALDGLGQHVNKIFGYTGNYLLLHQELQLLDENQFQLEHVYEIPMDNYYRTLDMWLKNLFDNREQLKAIATPQFYRSFRLYLKAVRRIFTHGYMRLDIVVSRQIG